MTLGENSDRTFPLRNPIAPLPQEKRSPSSLKKPIALFHPTRDRTFPTKTRSPGGKRAIAGYLDYCQEEGISPPSPLPVAA
jgi:hypothetical protein